ncbi:hypothetical protein RHMOL_Rhmol04G0359200 [Rhododendron molle]|uniref:Uncharacterized protein n=1 Tax=Rhododendron molle TaxID=49168 RepID=A0ACC0P7T6_RHOML|nr:hypothetical protein RHMOL_Rhmol04G0359200 [Rhododendron molle]
MHGWKNRTKPSTYTWHSLEQQFLHGLKEEKEGGGMRERIHITIIIIKMRSLLDSTNCDYGNFRIVENSRNFSFVTTRNFYGRFITLNFTKWLKFVNVIVPLEGTLSAF